MAQQQIQQSQVQTNFFTTSLPTSIKFSDLPCEVFSDFVSISCPLAENNFRDDAILSNRNDSTHEIEQGEIHLIMHEWLRISKFFEIKNKLEPECNFKRSFRESSITKSSFSRREKGNYIRTTQNKSVSNFHHSLFTEPDIFTAATLILCIQLMYSEK